MILLWNISHRSVHTECSTTVTKRRSKGSSVRNWIDEEIINLARAKRYWHKKLIDNRDNELIEAEYKLVLNRLTAARRAKKFRFYERKFGDGSEGLKETWKNIELAIHDGLSPRKNGTRKYRFQRMEES
jgi:hypothetical protein